MRRRPPGRAGPLVTVTAFHPPAAGPPVAGTPPVPDSATDGGAVTPAAIDGDDTAAPIDPIVRRRWERPALAALLVATGVLYIWGLSASGWANSYYSAAVQAGSQSWKAFLFGSTDAGNAITVDKPPMALWPMALSVRLLGLSTWSILVPEALMGVGTVAIVFATVRRRCGAVAGLLAGAALALTPVAVLMFRFNNPDALLVLLLTASAAALLRAIDDGRLRWVAAAGALIGFGFLTKQLQALVVVPGFAVAYLIAAHGTVGARIRGLVVGTAAMVAAAGWWIAIVMLWPAGSRPYVGGSQTNNILDLTLGYNGFGRITGEQTGSVGGGNGGGWGQTGWTRLIDGVIGGQIAWLLPAAILLSLGALWILRRAPRTDPRRAALLVFGSALLVTGLVFSFMQGIFHEYYTVALAPPIAVLVAVGASVVWRHRRHLAASLLLALTMAVTALWSATLLRRSPGWNAWLPTAITIVGVAAAVALAAGPRLGRRGGQTVAATAVLVALAGPAAWSVATAATGHSGSIVTAGPTVAGAGFGPGGGGRGFPGGQAAPGGRGGPGGQTVPTGGQGGFPAGAPGGGPPPADGGRDGAGGGMGGLLDATAPSAELVALLEADAGDSTWVAATVGANNAAGYQLATGDPVMAIGGFNGSDPAPTLEQFQALVAAGRIHWFVASGLEGATSMNGSDEARRIAEWVAANADSQTVDGVTLYDLS